MATCAIGLIWLQKVAETLKKVELKRPEPLRSSPEVAVRFYLMHILIAIIAFLWDALMRPFLDFFVVRAGYETSIYYAWLGGQIGRISQQLMPKISAISSIQMQYLANAIPPLYANNKILHAHSNESFHTI